MMKRNLLNIVEGCRVAVAQHPNSVLAIRRYGVWLDPTTDLTPLSGRRALLLADDENLRASANRVGCRLSYRRLGERLRCVTSSIYLHAYFSRDTGDHLRENYFLSRGWVPHPRDVVEHHTIKGIRRLSNSDHTIAFGAGFLAAYAMAEVVVLGTGDGELGHNLAAELGPLPNAPSIYTLGFATSTSRLLEARNSRWITGNIYLGVDVLERKGNSHVR